MDKWLGLDNARVKYFSTCSRCTTEQAIDIEITVVQKSKNWSGAHIYSFLYKTAKLHNIQKYLIFFNFLS